MERQIYALSSGAASRQLRCVTFLTSRALINKISVPLSNACPTYTSLQGRHRRALFVAANTEQPGLYSPGGPLQQQLPQGENAARSAWSEGAVAVAATLARLFRGFLTFVSSCGDVLPQFTVLSPQQALQRMILILAASLLMVVLLTTIDSGLLYVYVMMARRGA